MATSASEDFGTALARLIQLVFSPIFPLMFISFCGLSFLLTVNFGLPQFYLGAAAAKLALDYANGHLWAMGCLGLFVLAALPLAWVGFKEHASPLSRVIGHWIASGLGAAGLYWLATAWALDGTNGQAVVFSFLLFCLWAQLCETLLGTFTLVARLRPRPGREVVEAQMVHGRATVARESEALAMLKSKK